MPLGIWDLSFLTRDRTCAPCIGSAESLITGPPGKGLLLRLSCFSLLQACYCAWRHLHLLLPTSCLFRLSCMWLPDLYCVRNASFLPSHFSPEPQIPNHLEKTESQCCCLHVQALPSHLPQNRLLSATLPFTLPRCTLPGLTVLIGIPLSFILTQLSLFIYLFFLVVFKKNISDPLGLDFAPGLLFLTRWPQACCLFCSRVSLLQRPVHLFLFVSLFLIPYIVSCLVYLYCVHPQSVSFLKVLNILCVYSNNNEAYFELEASREMILTSPSLFFHVTWGRPKCSDQLMQEPSI